MADNLDPLARSTLMGKIGAKDTTPELIVRRGLHAAGLRYRLHASDLPGKPDLVFSRHRAVIFVHGCFWHGHDCPAFRMPSTRKEFWVDKIARNRERDQTNLRSLATLDWRVGVVWECSVRRVSQVEVGVILDRVAGWIRGADDFAEFRRV